MQRNWEVIRMILLKVEALPTTNSSLTSGELDGVDAGTVGFNMGLLIDAGLLKGTCLDTGDGRFCHAMRLTWTGYEFLDEIRKDAAWEKIKETVENKGLDLTFDTVKMAGKWLLTQIF